MKYTIDVDGDEILVDAIEFGTVAGSPDGNIDLYIRISDSDEDIYTDESKSSKWVDWLDKCLGTTRSPADRIKTVTAKVYGGDDDGECFRTIAIQNACIASFVERAQPDNYQYEVVIRRAPRKAKENLLSVEAG